MTATRVSRRSLFPASVAMFGAGAFASAASVASPLDKAAPETMLSAGVHSVDSNLTIRGDLLLQPGAVIDVAPGKTLTLLGSLMAPVARIFTGPGMIDLNRARIAWAHPEWWGALPGEARYDCLPALRACLIAHPAMWLLAADYHISDTLVVDRPFCRIEGAGHRGTAPGQGTRILLNSGTVDVLRVGPLTSPGKVNDFIQNVTIRSLALCRLVPVDVTRDVLPAGLRANFLLFADFYQISAFEHAIGFAAQGLVRTTFSECVAFRSLPGQQVRQRYRGFLLDGLGDIGLAGGNASLFLHDCNVTVGGDPSLSDAVGLLVEGSFADTFVTAFETTALTTGIRIDGKTDVIGGRARNGHVNLHLHLPIIDQCGEAGIDIVDTAPEASIDILDPYVAVAPGAQAAIRFRKMRGTTSIEGGQCIGGTNVDSGGSAIGIEGLDSAGLHIAGMKILDHAHPVSLTKCRGFSLRLAITSVRSRHGADGVVLRDCERGSAAIFMTGNSFTSGIRLAGGTQLRIDVTGIDAAAVGGAANRVMTTRGSVIAPARTADFIVEGL